MRHLRLLIGTLVAVGLVAVLAVSPAYAPPPFDPPGLDRAIAVQEYHTNSLMAVPGVVGTAVGLGADGQPVVKIYTESAGVTGLPRSLDGVPVVIQVTGRIFALHHCKGKHAEDPLCGEPPPGGGGGDGEGATDCSPTDRCPRPVPIGTSTGNEGECSAGTIGSRVKAGNVVYALSNNHVYALENLADIDSEVLQPGRFDTNCSVDANDVIATLAAFREIVFFPFPLAMNTIDAAIALSSTDDLGNATPTAGYGKPKSAIGSPAAGQDVQKYGRTTSLTKGTITGINATLNVGYNSGTAGFVGQIIVESQKPFLKSGDSGSLLVTDPSRNPVGLMFASNRSGKFAIANPIDLVLAEFGVTIDGE